MPLGAENHDNMEEDSSTLPNTQQPEAWPRSCRLVAHLLLHCCEVRPGHETSLRRPLPCVQLPTIVVEQETVPGEETVATAAGAQCSTSSASSDARRIPIDQTWRMLAGPTLCWATRSRVRV